MPDFDSEFIQRLKETHFVISSTCLALSDDMTCYPKTKPVFAVMLPVVGYTVWSVI